MQMPQQPMPGMYPYMGCPGMAPCCGPLPWPVTGYPAQWLPAMQMANQPQQPHLQQPQQPERKQKRAPGPKRLSQGSDSPPREAEQEPAPQTPSPKGAPQGAQTGEPLFTAAPPAPARRPAKRHLGGESDRRSVRTAGAPGAAQAGRTGGTRSPPGGGAARARRDGAGSQWSPGPSSKSCGSRAGTVATYVSFNTSTADDGDTSSDEEAAGCWTGRHGRDFVELWVREQGLVNERPWLAGCEEWARETAAVYTRRRAGSAPAPCSRSSELSPQEQLGQLGAAEGPGGAERGREPQPQWDGHGSRAISALGRDVVQAELDAIAEEFHAAQADVTYDDIPELCELGSTASDGSHSGTEAGGTRAAGRGAAPSESSRRRRAGRPDKLTRERRRRAEERAATSAALVALQSPMCSACGEAPAKAKCWHRDCRSKAEVFCGKCGQKHKEAFPTKHLPFLLFAEADCEDDVLMSSNPHATSSSGRTRRCRPPPSVTGSGTLKVARFQPPAAPTPAQA